MNAQSGNALFLILIAVALFAALSYAVTNSGRSSGGIEKEQAKIDQAVLDNYIAALDAARLRLNIIGGCSAIDYTAPAAQGGGDKSCFMFHPDGGGVAYQNLGLDSCQVATGESLDDLALGEACGGLIYAGTSGGNRLYTATVDLGTMQWSADDTLPSTSTNDGLANTDTLVGLSDTTYTAAESCRALGEGWYLPAVDELNVLYTNRNTGDLSGTFPAEYHWTSTSAASAGYARWQNFTDGSQGQTGKQTPRRVRCVTRG